MKKEHKDFLDDLRETGVTNMFGAGQYLMQEFDIDKTTARAILLEWIKTYK